MSAHKQKEHCSNVGFHTQVRIWTYVKLRQTPPSIKHFNCLHQTYSNPEECNSRYFYCIRFYCTVCSLLVQF